MRLFPAVMPVDAHRLLVSDGAGALYWVLVTQSGAQASAIQNPFTDQSAVMLLDARATANGVVVLLARFVIDETASFSPTGHARAAVTHVEMMLCNAGSSDQEALQTLLLCKSAELPSYAAIDDCDGIWLVGTTAANILAHPLSDPVNSVDIPNDVQPNQDQNDQEMQQAMAASQDPLPPAPFSWHQTADDVTVYVPFPPTLPYLPSTNVGATFEPDRIRLTLPATHQHHLHDAIARRASLSSEQLPFVFDLPLHATVKVADCFWTLERTRIQGVSEKAAIVTIHLEKRHAGTRWSHLLDLSLLPLTAQHAYDIQETLDPNVLAEITESLEKYTLGSDQTQQQPGDEGMTMQAIAERVNRRQMEHDLAMWESEPSSAHAAQEDSGPGLTQRPIVHEQEELCDVGSSMSIQRLSSDGRTERFMTSGMTWIGNSFTRRSGGQLPAFGCRRDVDMVAFRPDTNGTQVTHVATFPAFGYVQASKQNKKLTLFTDHDGERPSYAIVLDGQKFAFVYQALQPPSLMDGRGSQCILEFDGDSIDGAIWLPHQRRLLILASDQWITVDLH
jgi:hypothetical protein